MEVTTYVPDTKDDPWGETLLPIGVLLDDCLHEGKELGRVVFDLAVDLVISHARDATKES